MGGVDQLPGSRSEDQPMTFLVRMPPDDEQLSGRAGVPQVRNGVSSEDEAIDRYIGIRGGPMVDLGRY